MLCCLTVTDMCIDAADMAQALAPLCSVVSINNAFVLYTHPRQLSWHQLVLSHKCHCSQNVVLAHPIALSLQDCPWTERPYINKILYVSLLVRNSSRWQMLGWTWCADPYQCMLARLCTAWERKMFTIRHHNGSCCPQKQPTLLLARPVFANGMTLLHLLSIAAS